MRMVMVVHPLRGLINLQNDSARYDKFGTTWVGRLAYTIEATSSRRSRRTLTLNAPGRAGVARAISS